MNASAYLHNHGWRGEGFSLDCSNRGLAKPLLVSHKSDLSGLGTKKNDFGNQWWTDAFDKRLKAFSSQNQIEPVPSQKPAKRGLYTSFVKAETLASTMKDDVVQSGTARRKMTKDTKEPGFVMSAAPESTRQFGVLGIPPSEALNATSVEEKKEKPKKKRPFDDIRDPDTGVITRPSKMPKKEFMKKVKKANKVERKEKKMREAKEKRMKARERAKASRSVQTTVVATEEPAKGDQVEGDGVKDGANYIRISEPSEKADLSRKKKQKKEKTREIRSQRKAENAVKAGENAMRNQGKAKAKVAATAAEKYSDPTRELRRPLHPESIMALREQGAHIDLPGDHGDKDRFRLQLIKCYESGMVARAKHVLISAARFADSTHEAQNDSDAAGVKPKRRLAQKYERETKKRQLNREAKHWVEVRANPHLYRPDGSWIQPLSRGVSQEELSAVNAANEEERRRVAAKKRAERDLKAKVKAQKVAEKMKRREEKKRSMVEATSNQIEGG